MPQPSIHLLEDPSRSRREKLTHLLRLPPAQLPTTAWLSAQATLIEGLPKSLQRPTSALLRLGMSISGRSGPNTAHLCPSHKKLNPYLIRRIFIQVSAECTTRLSRLLSNQNLDPQIKDHVDRLQRNNSLWMSTDLYQASYGQRLGKQRFERVASNCEACILAAVGGNPYTLCDLRTSMLGRKKKGGKTPRLLKLVDEWIRWLPEETREDVLTNSLYWGREVRRCRRKMQVLRRLARKDTKDANGRRTSPLEQIMSAGVGESARGGDRVDDGGMFEEPDHDWAGDRDEDEDPESDIIRVYAESMHSMAPLLQRDPTEEDMHPAFASSTMLPLPIPVQAPLANRSAAPTSSSEISSTYASVTNASRISAVGQVHDRLSAENLQCLEELPPRPVRPQNRSIYTDNVSALRHVPHEMSQISAMIPPLRPQQAYTASIYSNDVPTVRPRGPQSTMTGYAARSSDERAREYAELTRRAAEEQYIDSQVINHNAYVEDEYESEDEGELPLPPVPIRSPRRETHWSDFAGRPYQDGW